MNSSTEAEMELLIKHNVADIAIITRDQDTIYQFSIEIFSAMDIVRKTLASSTINFQTKNELKDLFYKNLVFVHLDVIESIHASFINHVNLYQKSNDSRLLVEIGRLSTTDVFIEIFIEFQQFKFNGSVLDKVL